MPFSNASIEDILEVIQPIIGEHGLDTILVKRIIRLGKSVGLWDNIELENIGDNIHSVHNKYVQFYENISLEQIYTLDDDPDARTLVNNVKGNVENRANNPLTTRTINFSDIRIANLGQALHENPEIVDLCRYFTGMGDITFELLASAWLHNENYFTGVIKFHGISQIKRLLNDNLEACNCTARHLISEFGLRPKLKILNSLNRNQRSELVDILSSYQIKGRMSKLGGHMAEMIIARQLDSLNIDFEPREKLTTLGVGDISIPNLHTDRQFNFAIPNRNNPNVIIECAYYISNTGGVAGKAIRELTNTKRMILNSPNTDIQNIKLIGFIDGPGWIAMSGGLIKMLIVVDDFIQLNNLANLNRYTDNTR